MNGRETDEAVARLKGTYAISGGLGGLGRASARVILRRGGDVILTGRRRRTEVELELAALSEESGADRSRIAYHCVNRIDIDLMSEIFMELPLGGAVVSAGMMIGQPVLEISAASLTESFAVNTIGGFIFAQAAAQRMRDIGEGGAIVTLSSWAAHRPKPGGGAYAASKAGIEALMRSIALELAPVNIRANSVTIGIVEGDGMAARNFARRPGYQAEIEKAMPLGRLATPDELGRLVAWLLSEDAAYLSGADIRFDGAASLAPSY